MGWDGSEWDGMGARARARLRDCEIDRQDDGVRQGFQFWVFVYMAIYCHLFAKRQEWWEKRRRRREKSTCKRQPQGKDAIPRVMSTNSLMSIDRK
jgi:hypothetical protein